MGLKGHIWGRKRQLCPQPSLPSPEMLMPSPVILPLE